MKMFQKILNAKAWKILSKTPMVEFISVKPQAYNAQTAINSAFNKLVLVLSDYLHLEKELS